MDEKDQSERSIEDGGPAAADRRPKMTIDLKAKEIPDERRPQAAFPPSDEARPEDRDMRAEAEAGDGGEDGADDAPQQEEPSRPPREARAARPAVGPAAASLVTHALAGLVGGLLALVAAFYGVDQFRDRMTAFSGATAEELRGEIRALSGRVAAAAAQAGGGQTATEIAALREALKALDAQIAAASARLERAERSLAAGGPAASPADAASLKAAVEPLERRVGALETKVEEVARAQASQTLSVNATALAVAFVNLRRAVASGRPFAAELDAAEKLGAPAEGLAALAQRKDSGVKTVAELREALPALIRKALEAEHGSADESFISRLWAQAQSVVRVRRTGLVEGEAAEAVLARIEVRIEAGDAAAAANEAAKLKGEPAVILRDWVAEAQARAAADASLDRMEAQLLTSLKAESPRR